MEIYQLFFFILSFSFQVVHRYKTSLCDSVVYLEMLELHNQTDTVIYQGHLHLYPHKIIITFIPIKHQNLHTYIHTQIRDYIYIFSFFRSWCTNIKLYNDYIAFRNARTRQSNIDHYSFCPFRTVHFNHFTKNKKNSQN